MARAIDIIEEIRADTKALYDKINSLPGMSKPGNEQKKAISEVQGGFSFWRYYHFSQLLKAFGVKDWESG